MKRITKQDLKGAQVRYYNSEYDLIDSHYDEFDSISDAINRKIHRNGSLKYVQIFNNETGFYGEYRVNNPCGVVLGFRKIA